MKNIELLHASEWNPLSYFGIRHSLFALNENTIINTWIVLVVLTLLIFIARIAITRRSGVARYIVISYVRSFIDLCSQSFGFFSYTHTAFIIALFTFILLCNIISIIPWVEEPTIDLNTTLALGIIAFTYIQAYAIKAHGLWGYLKEYFTPFFFMFPMHVIGKLSTIVSISFRLFGNIFGGATIVTIYSAVIQSSWIAELLTLVSGLNIIIVGFFIIFEGFLQAFVFAMLTLTYLSIALAHDEDIGEMT